MPMTYSSRWRPKIRFLWVFYDTLYVVVLLGCQKMWMEIKKWQKNCCNVFSLTSGGWNQKRKDKRSYHDKCAESFNSHSSWPDQQEGRCLDRPIQSFAVDQASPKWAFLFARSRGEHARAKLCSVRAADNSPSIWVDVSPYQRYAFPRHICLLTTCGITNETLRQFKFRTLTLTFTRPLLKY